jgi:hypothetical protein
LFMVHLKMTDVENKDLLEWNKWWKNSHQSIVNGSKKRTLIKAEGSANNIPKERPDVIACSQRLGKIGLEKK